MVTNSDPGLQKVKGFNAKSTYDCLLSAQGSQAAN